MRLGRCMEQWAVVGNRKTWNIEYLIFGFNKGKMYFDSKQYWDVIFKWTIRELYIYCKHIENNIPVCVWFIF
jgi:hypothetical protein